MSTSVFVRCGVATCLSSLPMLACTSDVAPLVHDGAPADADATPADARPPRDAPPTDTPLADARALDAPLVDARLIDASPLDAALIDARLIDATPVDAVPIDAVPVDAVAIDAPAIDAGPPLALTVCADGSADFTTIGAAVAAATPGSTVTVCAGTYHERLALIAMPLELIGAAGAAATVIDGDLAGTVIEVVGVGDPGVEVRGFTIQRGSTAAEGGGVRCQDSRLALRDSVVADSRGAGGGGLFAQGCRLDVTATRFERNDGGARGGGALLVDSAGAVVDSQLLANRATEGAGAASLGGSVELRGGAVRANIAGLRGGGLYHASDAAITDAVIADNTAGWTGGGLHVVGHAPVIATTTISGNHAANDGGGVYLHQSAAVLRANHIIANISDDDGGGIRAFESPTTLAGNLIERNRTADGGGGVRVSHVPAVLRDNLVRDNYAGGTGGGLDLDNDASLVHGGAITGNYAGGSGGGIYGWLAPWTGLVIEDVEISRNRAWQGGGIYLVDNFTPVTMRRLRMVGNRASKGAGLMVRSTTFTLTNSLLADNIATDRGGAIFASQSPPWTEPCVCPPVTPVGRVDFVVLSGNTAPRGAALWTTFTDLTMANSIVVASVGPAIEAVAPDATPGAPAVPVLRYGDVHPASFVGMDDPTGSAGNLAQAPQFVSATDFHLAAGSPCIDHGDPALTDADGTRADMGMFGGAL